MAEESPTAADQEDNSLPEDRAVSTDLITPSHHPDDKTHPGIGTPPGTGPRRTELRLRQLSRM